MIQRPSTRLIVNTAAQYTRTVINLVLSLYSTRLILNALGLADYGIFTLIAGVVSMLAFMTNAMVTTTQRFMSYHQTKSSLDTQQIIFSNSVLMHIGASVLVMIILEIIGPFLFDGFLNIAPERLNAAKVIYQCAIAMILLSFITAPYKALLISHENIIYTSIVEVCDGVIKVVIAIALTKWGADKLIMYGFLMLAINLLDFFAYTIYDFRNYNECVLPRLKSFSKKYLKSMSSFIGWQLYSTGCIIGRTQGTAIILNKFFGTVVNASFGIALQISAAVNFVSSSLSLAINPQIIKAEGAGDRQKMFQLAEISSKFSFLLLAAIVIPLLFVLPQVLHLWLGKVPEWSVLFCSVILITSLVDQITLGLGAANQAIGNVGPYSRVVNTVKILTLPILLLLLFCNVKLELAIWCYPIIELICALTRLPFLRITGGLKVGQYIHNVIGKLLFPTSALILFCWGISLYHFKLIIFIVCMIPTIVIYGFIIFQFSLTFPEKNIVIGLLNSVHHQFKRI